jgi:hypothetical protein
VKKNYENRKWTYMVKGSVLLHNHNHMFDIFQRTGINSKSRNGDDAEENFERSHCGGKILDDSRWITRLDKKCRSEALYSSKAGNTQLPQAGRHSGGLYEKGTSDHDP